MQISAGHVLCGHCHAQPGRRRSAAASCIDPGRRRSPWPATTGTGTQRPHATEDAAARLLPPSSNSAPIVSCNERERILGKRVEATEENRVGAPGKMKLPKTLVQTCRMAVDFATLRLLLLLLLTTTRMRN